MQNKPPQQICKIVWKGIYNHNNDYVVFQKVVIAKCIFNVATLCKACYFNK